MFTLNLGYLIREAPKDADWCLIAASPPEAPINVFLRYQEQTQVASLTPLHEPARNLGQNARSANLDYFFGPLSHQPRLLLQCERGIGEL